MRPLCAVLQMDSALEILLLPGMAFDAHGNRLGRGGGCDPDCAML